MKAGKPSKLIVTDGETKVTVAVSFATRKRMTLTVYPDKRVVAKAPKRASAEDLLAFVEKRIPWIFKQLNYLDTLPPPAPKKQFTDGELHPFLGRQVPLRVKRGLKNALVLKDNFFEMSLKLYHTSDVPENLMKKFYFKTSRKYLAERFWKIFPLFARMGVKKPELQFRRMKRRWGSCCKGKAKVLLNSELIKASPRHIDYVLVHELCHMIHNSHSKDFYRLLTRILPDWKERKKELDQIDL